MYRFKDQLNISNLPQQENIYSFNNYMLRLCRISIYDFFLHFYKNSVGRFSLTVPLIEVINKKENVLRRRFCQLKLNCIFESFPMW